MEKHKSGGRREVGPVLGLIAVGTLLYGTTAPFYFRPDDDGLAMFDALLVLRGQRPYLDFFVHDSPLINYWHALLLQIGGLDMLTLRYGLVPFKILLLPAIYLLARPVASRGLAAVAALMVLMADTAVNFGMPHPGWYALALALLGLLGIRAWLGSGRGAWLVGAGLALGLAVAVKQNLGVFVLAAAVLFLLEPATRVPPAAGLVFAPAPAGWRLWTLRALAWAGALGGLLFMVRDQFRLDVIALLWLPILALAGGSLCIRPAPVDDRVLLGATIRRLGLLAGGVVLGIGPWLLALGTISGFDQLIPGLILVPGALPRVMFFPYKPPAAEFWWLALAVVGTPLLCWGLLRVRPGGRRLAAGGVGLAVLAVFAGLGGFSAVYLPGIYSWYYGPPALIWLAGLLCGPGWRRAPATPLAATHALYDRLLLYGAAFGMIQLFPLMDRVHGAWSYPFTLPLLALILARVPAGLAALLPGAPAIAPPARRVLLASLLVLPLFWAWFIVEWRLSLGWDLPASVAAGRPVPSSWQPIGLPHLSLEAPDMAPAQFQGVYALIQQKTRPGEPIYAFPNEQAFYVFCDRPRGSRYSFLLPGVTTDAEQQAVMGDLRQNNVRYVIMFVPAPGMERVTAGYGALDPLADYIRSHYHALQVFGERPGYAVMERN